MKRSRFSQRVIALRRRAGWKQETMAAKLGVSFATVNRWENGWHEPHRPMMTSLTRLFVRYGVR